MFTGSKAEDSFPVVIHQQQYGRLHQSDVFGFNSEPHHISRGKHEEDQSVGRILLPMEPSHATSG